MNNPQSSTPSTYPNYVLEFDCEIPNYVLEFDCVPPKVEDCRAFKLTDCVSNNSFLVPYTDELNNYVNITIKVLLPSGKIYCYTVESAVSCEDLLRFEGEILDYFKKCEDCIPECKCTRAVNNSVFTRKLQYLDCNNELQETAEFIPSGKTSKKYCVLEWRSDEIEIINFGDCKDNECPETPRPKKFIAPGYNTPICSPENYERIVCRYSENKYKEVMDKRYGIENCCTDDSIQNNIKYELIHLQILKDLDYECVSNNNPCGCNGGVSNLSSHNCNS